MKKKTAGLMAAASAAILMLSGFDSAMTVQELQQKAKDAFAQMRSADITFDGGLQATLNLTQDVENGAAMDIPMNISGSGEWKLNMEPFRTQMDVQYSLEAMGQGNSGAIQMFVIENDDGTGNACMGITEEGATQWENEPIDAENLAKVKDMVRSALAGDTAALSSLTPDGNTEGAAAAADMLQKYQEQIAGVMQIAPQSVNVNGRECYQLTADLSGDVLSRMFSDAIAASGQEMDDMSLQMAQAVMAGLNVRIESGIDAQTFLPVSGHIDMDGSDFTSIEQLLLSFVAGEQSGMSARLDVTRLGADFTFQCNEPVTIEPPQEALNAAADIDDADPDDLIGGLLTGGNGPDNGDDTGTDDIDLNSSGNAVLNEDGTYRITYEDYSGNVRKADVAVPDGMKLSYGTDDYISFATDDYSKSVSYSLFAMATPQETVESDLDVSFMEGNSDYSEVTRTDVMQTVLPDGNTVYYGSRSYVYNRYRLGGTSAALQAGGCIVNIEIQPEDARHNVVEASEEEVQYYAGLVRPAA